MSSVDSQVVDGVWGQPIADPGPAAPEYNPSPGVPESAPDNLPMGQEVAPHSPWDVAPTQDEYVQVAQPPQTQPEPQQEPQEAAAPSSPDDTLRQQVEEMRQQLAQRDQREQDGRRQWEALQRETQQQQVFAQRQKAMSDAIEQAQFLDTDAQKTFLTNQFNTIDQQYRQDIQQTQRQAQQNLDATLRQAMVPIYTQELLQQNGLPSEFAQYFKGVSPDSMEHMVPTLKAMHDMKQQIEQSNQQTQASNFNEWQRQNGVNRVASSNGSPAGVGSVKSGTVEHLGAIMRSMG